MFLQRFFILSLLLFSSSTNNATEISIPNNSKKLTPKVYIINKSTNFKILANLSETSKNDPKQCKKTILPDKTFFLNLDTSDKCHLELKISNSDYFYSFCDYSFKNTPTNSYYIIVVKDEGIYRDIYDGENFQSNSRYYPFFDYDKVKLK